MSQFHRLFIALWPDNVTRQALATWQSSLSGRKTPLENLHMTLVFLGEQPEEKLPVLSELISTISFKTIELALDKMGYFAHSKIIWAGTQKAPASLFQLHKVLSKELIRQSVSFDKRSKFKPHVTLVRHSKHPGKVDLKPVIWKADRLVLVESRFIKTDKGTFPKYIPIAKHPCSN